MLISLMEIGLVVVAQTQPQNFLALQAALKKLGRR